MMVARPDLHSRTITLVTANIRGGSLEKTAWVKTLVSQLGTVAILTETHSNYAFPDPEVRILSFSQPIEHNRTGGVAIACSPATARLLGPVSTNSTTHGCSISNRQLVIGGIYVPPSYSQRRVANILSTLLTHIVVRGQPVILGGDLNFCQFSTNRRIGNNDCRRGFNQVARRWRLALVPPADRPAALAHRACLDNFCTSGGPIRVPIASLSPLGAISDHAFVVSVQCAWQPEGINFPRTPKPSIPKFKNLNDPLFRASLALELLGQYDMDLQRYPPSLLGQSHRGIDPIPDRPHYRSHEGIRDFFMHGVATHGHHFVVRIIDAYDGVLRSTLLATAKRVLGTVVHTRARNHHPPGVDSDLQDEGDISHAIAAYFRRLQPPPLIQPRDSGTEPDAVQDSVAFYLSTFAQHEADDNDDHKTWRPRCYDPRVLRPPDSERFTDFPLDFVILNIRDSKSGKASGNDQIPCSLIKAIVNSDDDWKGYLRTLRNTPAYNDYANCRPEHHPFLQSLTLLFRMCIVARYTPQSWNESIIQPVAKGEHPTLTIDNCRPISLTVTFRRLFEKCLLRRCTDRDRHHPDLRPADIPLGRVSRLQAGFRRGYSTMSHILIADESLKLLPLTCTLLDIKQAYDSVPVHRVLSLLTERLGPDYLPFIHLIESLFLVTSSAVRLNGATSPPFPRERGLFQGSLLSPMLFNIFIDPLACAVDDLGRRRFPRNIVPPALFYADDILLLAMSDEETVAMVSLVQEWCSSNFMTLNYAKCHIIRSTREDPTADLILPTGAVIAACPGATYLGAPLTNNGVDFDRMAPSFAARARKVQMAVFRNPATAHWSPLWRTIFSKIFVFSTMEYLAPLLWSHCETLGQFALFEPIEGVIQSSMCWILNIWRTPSRNGHRDPRVGFNVIRSFLGFGRARDRAQYLAAMFNLHILSSHSDNPVRHLGIDLNSGDRDIPDVHRSLLTPLLGNAMWDTVLQALNIEAHPLQTVPKKDILRECLSAILRYRTASLPQAVPVCDVLVAFRCPPSRSRPLLLP